MKATAGILWFILLFCTRLPAQIDCHKFLEQGKKAAKQENFELAMNSFNSARRCGDKEMGEWVDKEVAKLFRAINGKKEQAEIEKQRAQEQQKIAEQEKRRALEQQKIAEQEKQRAEEQTKIAEQEKRRAEEQTKIAQAARDSAIVLLKKFKTASAETVDALVREANNLIYHLDYTAAAAKLRAAADLHQPTPSFRNAVAEVAFFWNEIGQTTQAADLLVAAQQTDVSRQQVPLRAWLKTYAGSWYDSLLLRYYPNMLPVPAGETDIKARKAAVSAFKIARTETTMWQYAIYFLAIGKDIKSDRRLASLSWGISGDNPVVEVSWYDAARYANWLSNRTGFDSVYIFGKRSRKTFRGYDYIVHMDTTAKGYRLPSQVEWEYAARGGPAHDLSDYAGSHQIDSVGWCFENSGNRPHPVAGKKANLRLGLYDMSGNAAEWCGDWYSWSRGYPDNFPANYRGPDSGVHRIVLGGHWHEEAVNCHTTSSFIKRPMSSHNYLGFRLALQL